VCVPPLGLILAIYGRIRIRSLIFTLFMQELTLLNLC
jgi:hypothetical protein